MIKCFVVIKQAVKHSAHKVRHYPIVRRVHKPLKYLAAKPIATATVVCVVVGGGAMPWLAPKSAPPPIPGPFVQPVPAYSGESSLPFGSGFISVGDTRNLFDSSETPFSSTTSPIFFMPPTTSIEDITLPQLDMLKPMDINSLDITKPVVENLQVDEPPSLTLLVIGLLALIVMRTVRCRIFELRR